MYEYQYPGEGLADPGNRCICEKTFRIALKLVAANTFVQQGSRLLKEEDVVYMGNELSLGVVKDALSQRERLS